MTLSMTAAAAVTCPGRVWGHPEGYPRRDVTPTPPRHFTFEIPVGTSSTPRPRRRHRRVLYPPVVRRPPPQEEPSAAKRLLVLLLAVVSAQIYHTPGDTLGDTPEVTLSPKTPAEVPLTSLPLTSSPLTSSPLPPLTSSPGQGDLLLLRTLNGTLVGAPMGASCPPTLLLHPH
ncbi:radiation-inducible immediate-early gene IEX-1 [Porphyrio hochstetteri]